MYTLWFRLAAACICIGWFSQHAATQTYFLNGDATFIGGDCYRLTQAINYQNGTVWYGNQIDLTQPFDIQFRMNLGTNDANGADGICFVLQTVGTSAIGQSGGGMGYLNFGTSLGIEFDTWQNSEYNDPSFDHIAIHRNGNINHTTSNNLAGPVQMHPFNANTEDGLDHVVQINWDPATFAIQVYFDCYFRLQAYVDLVNSIFSGQNLVYWGFTAATGGAVNNQTVCLQENILNVGDAVTICPGASTTLSAGASLNGVYTWSPADFLSDPQSAAPEASPPTTMVYNVQFTDLCGNNVNSDITVFVEPLAITIPPELSLTCTNPQSQIIATSNFAFTDFTWSDADGEVVSATPQLIITTPGLYTVDAVAQEFCFASAVLNVVDNTIPPDVDAGPDQVITCTNPTAEINASTSAISPVVLWTSSGGGILSPSSSLNPTVTSPGTFTLTISDPSNGCASSDQVVVTADLVPPVVSIPAQDTLSCLRSEVTITGISVQANGNAFFQWFTEEGNIVLGADTSNPLVNAAGEYAVLVTDDSNGCSVVQLVSIEESGDVNVDLSSLDFPNVITPNGDDYNSTWRPFLRSDRERDLSPFLPVYELKIFNRWGQMLFETQTASSGWNPGDTEAGVFYYMLRFETACGGGFKGVREGYIHLLR